MTQMLAAIQADSLSAFGTLPLMIGIFLIFYFIWFMPIRKKQKALDKLLEELKKGDEVVTNGGLHGEVVKAEDQIVVLEVAANVKIRVSRRAIAGLQGSEEERGS